MLYLDHNATTPVLPAVIEAMGEALRRHWANPSSQHEAGQAARGALQHARAQVARCLGCQPAELVFTSEATQLVGKLPFDFARGGADLVSVSAHKFGGPKGVGALIVRKGLNWPALFAGSQERGRRGGTENLPGIVGFGVAAEHQAWTAGNWHDRSAKLAALRDRFEARLRTACPELVVYGASQPRLPQTSFLRLGHAHADLALQKLSSLGALASSGSACSSGGQAASHVLAAMGVPREEALGAVRLSFAPATPAADLLALADAWPRLVSDGHACSTFSHPPTGVAA